MPANSPEILNMVKKHKQAKKQRTIYLERLKESLVGTNIHEDYRVQKNKTDKIWEELKKIKTEQRFLGFKSFHQFLGEFGWALGLFIYSCFNIVITFFKKNRTIIGETVLHSVLMFVSLYFIVWAIQPYVSDFEKSTYIFYSILMTLFIVFAIYRLISDKVKYINTLMLNIKDLIGFMFKSTKEEKEEEMWDILKDIKHERER